MTSSDSNTQEIDVEQDLGFSLLQNLLQAKDWKEADHETCKIMMKVNWRKPPKEVLKTLDELWVSFSDGRFGFGIQQKIYFECGGKVDDLTYLTQGYDQDWYHSTWIKFAKHIGWTKDTSKDWIYYENLVFNISAPKGHLPCVGGAYNHYIDRRCGGPGRFYPMALHFFLELES